MKIETHQYLDIVHDLYLTEPEKQALIGELVQSLSKDQLLDLLFFTLLASEKTRTTGPEKKV